ncbi:MAG: hypothetical protein KF756_09240 [Acidobacteria bacterium]|nr:hypothetical protein [Acidobacteriota bacterium]
MKRLILLSLIVLASSVAFGQKPKKDGPKLDVADFNAKVAVAQWLVEYDNVAWKTTDVLLKEDKAKIQGLGAEWFCFKDDKQVWHAVYGKLTEKGYVPAFHYVMAASGEITLSTDKIDQDFLDTHAKALATSSTKFRSSVPAGSPKCNQYVRRNADKTFSVWLLPAFQANGVAVYGGEGIYTRSILPE